MMLATFNGLDLLGMVGVVCLVAGGMWWARQQDEREALAEREFEHARIASEIEGVPVEWLGALDAIRYLPETPFDWQIEDAA